MAKILNKIYRTFLSLRINDLLAKSHFYHDLLLVTKEKNHQLAQTNLQEETDIQNKKLMELAKKSSVLTPALLKKKQEELAIIEKNYYWKKRALEQTKVRKAKKDVKQADCWYEKNASLLAFEESQTKKYVEDKYRYTNQKQDVLAYEKANDEVTAYLAQYEKVVDAWEQDKTTAFTNKTNKKIALVEKKLARMQPKFSQLLQEETISHHQLDESSILRLDDLSMHFGGLKAVDRLSFEVKKGEIFGLIGPNGAGKTTVFNCITQFYKPTSGNIYYSNNKNEVINLNHLKTHNIIKEGIVRTFQNVELIWEISVLDNLLVSGHTLYKTRFFSHVFSTRHLYQEEVVLRQKALHILAKLGLLAYQYMIPYGLPYGILKKIELARTLMVNPRLIILDEPAAGLNEEETKELANVIRQIRQEYQVTIFLVEHDMGLVMNLCDTICAISFGKLLAIGKPEEIQKNKLVIEAYLGGE